MAKSSAKGDRDTARASQIAANVPENLRGPWFHVSKDNVPELTDHVDEEKIDDPFTWLSRSPGGGGHAGGCVHVIYVVQTPKPFRIYPAHHGDPIGKEKGQFLKDWWLAVPKTQIDTLMVVQTFSEQAGVEDLKQFLDDPDYLAIRQSAIQSSQV